jgi:hypothetical protein
MSEIYDSCEKIPIHIEVALREDVNLAMDELQRIILQRLSSNYHIFYNHMEIIGFEDIAEYVSIGDINYDKHIISFWQAEFIIHIFKLSHNWSEKEMIENEDDLPAAEQWELPNVHLSGYWDSVVVDQMIKKRLLGYTSTSMQFSEALINTDIITCNRIMLLHGPPGTGKTTLAKSLAQKTFIRQSQKYTSGGLLLEINSHSLFSKWFSESGKLVMKLFEHINDVAEDTETFVAVLIDEVESITSIRTSNSSEPGDAVRVVNSVLTCLDNLKRRTNVLVLCTSNMLSSIDPAFVDRIDFKVYIGNPNLSARYQILHSCIIELMSKGIIKPAVSLESWINADFNNFESNEYALYNVSIAAEGFSGRSLRKLPLQAHAFHLDSRPCVTYHSFIAGMRDALNAMNE